MYNMYDDDDIEMKEEQLIYYIDEKEEDTIQEEEFELPEITEDYLTFVVSMKKEYDDCKRIICLDSIKSFYDDENNRMLFSVDIK